MLRRQLLKLTAVLLAGAAMPRLAWAKTVTDAKGTVEVPDDPQRVVAMYSTDADSALVLGLPLVAMSTARGGVGEGFAPYQQPYGLDGIAPINIFPSANFEQVASFQPDLIIGSYMVEENAYELLSAIAPTYWLPDGDWKVQLRSLADAVGKTETAEEFISAFDARATALRAAMPQGQKVALISRMPEQTFRIVQAPRMPILYNDLGFVPSKLTPPNFEGEVHYSVERLDVLNDADIILMMTTPAGDGSGDRLAGEYDDLVAAPGWDDVPAVKAGKAIFIGYELTYDSPLVAQAVLDFAEADLV